MKTNQTHKRNFQTIATAAFMLISTAGFAQQPAIGNTKDSEQIRPFHIHVSDNALNELRQRINTTRWPDKETVADQSQGIKLDQIKKLTSYWGTDYDWRKAEKKLNNLPQFITNIDGLDIQFVHIKSKHKNALPLIITHG